MKQTFKQIFSRKYHFFEQTAILSTVLFSLFSVFAIVPISINHEEAKATNGDPNPAYLYINFNSSSATLDINSSNFISTNNTNNVSFDIQTNNATGYNLSIYAEDDDGTLVGDSDAFESVDQAISSSTFSDSSYYTNKWGFKPSRYNGNSNEYYRPSPTTEGTVIDDIYEPTSNSYSIDIGAKANSSMPLGEYTRVFNLTLTANPINYSIAYDKYVVDDDSIANIPYIQNGYTSNPYIILDSLVPTRDNYTFVGWCAEYPQDEQTCDSNLFQPGDEFGLDQTTSYTQTILYAIWQPGSTQPTRTLQSYTPEMCEQQEIGSYWTLVDARDGENYVVGKLADERCWFLDNLRFDDTSVKLTKDNSNVPYTENDNYYLTGVFSGDDYEISPSVPNVRTDNRDVIPELSFGNGSRKIGNYYNYCAATAGTYCDQNNISVTDVVEYSLCPKGWRLPTSTPVIDVTPNYNNESSNLLRTFNSFESLIEGFSIAFGGHTYQNRITNLESWPQANFWASTQSDAQYANSIVVTYETSFSQAYAGSGRNNSNSIRCIQQTADEIVEPEPEPEIFYEMQNIKQDTLDTLEIGTTIHVTDTRTGFNYEASVVEDRNNNKTIWMNENLKVPAGTTMHNTDTNITSDFTLSTEAWTSSSQRYYCKQLMTVINGEYYYNWYAAKANPYECNDPTDYENATSENDAKSLGDICPRGWKMGSGINYSDYRSTLSATGSVSSAQQYGVGQYGRWWTNYRVDEETASNVTYNNNDDWLDDYYDPKSSGASIRCIFDGGTNSSTMSMQSPNQNTLNSLPVNGTTIMRDARTNNKYVITKIELDGVDTLWMNSNLKVPSNLQLTPLDTNISDDFVLSSEEWTSGDQNYYCKQIMKVGSNDEYYYNWYAAIANPYECENPTDYTNSTAENDAKSLGDICPQGWRLPTTNDFNLLVPFGISLPGVTTVTGKAYTGIVEVPSSNVWWSSSRDSVYHADTMVYDGSLRSGPWYKFFGYSVRCLRTLD